MNLEAPTSGQEAKKKGGLSSCTILMPLQWDVKAGLLWPQFQRMLHCANQIGREIGATVSPYGDVPRKWEPSAGSGMWKQDQSVEGDQVGGAILCRKLCWGLEGLGGMLLPLLLVCREWLRWEYREGFFWVLCRGGNMA